MTNCSRTSCSLPGSALRVSSRLWLSVGLQVEWSCAVSVSLVTCDSAVRSWSPFKSPYPRQTGNTSLKFCHIINNAPNLVASNSNHLVISHFWGLTIWPGVTLVLFLMSFGVLHASLATGRLAWKMPFWALAQHTPLRDLCLIFISPTETGLHLFTRAKQHSRPEQEGSVACVLARLLHATGQSCMASLESGDKQTIFPLGGWGSFKAKSARIHSRVKDCGGSYSLPRAITVCALEFALNSAFKLNFQR